MINTDNNTKGFLLHFHTYAKKINPNWDKKPKLFVLIRQKAYFLDKNDLKKCIRKWNQCKNWAYCLTAMDVKENESTGITRIPKGCFIHHGEQKFIFPTLGIIQESPINCIQKVAPCFDNTVCLQLEETNINAMERLQKNKE